MTCVIVGTLKDQKGRNLFILDKLNNQTYTVEAANDDTFELEIGSEGIFVGNETNGVITVTRHEIRKFLNPMYEEDLIGVAGRIIIDLIDDPFPAIYDAKVREAENGDSSD